MMVMMEKMVTTVTKMMTEVIKFGILNKPMILIGLIGVEKNLASSNEIQILENRCLKKESISCLCIFAQEVTK